MSGISINSNEFLSSLVNSGPDASKNLFRVTIKNTGLTEESDKKLIDSFTVRTLKFDAPNIAQSLVDIPYYNFNFKKKSPSFQVSQEKVLSFNIRLDEDYKVYDFLKENMEISENGKYYPRDNKYFLLEVEVLKPSTSAGVYETTKTWTFHNCSVYSIDRLSYSYTDSSPMIVQVSIIYGRFDFM